MPKNENTNPSTSPTGSGVFESIRGHKSLDVEEDSLEAADKEAAAQAQQTEEETPGQEEAQPEAAAEGKGDSPSEIQARQRMAQLERRLAEMGPWAQLSQALAQDPYGREILERVQKGEPLMAGDRQEMRERIQSTGVTKQELNDLLNQREAANRQITELTSLAEEKLADYKQIRRNPQFVGLLDAAIAASWNGSIPLHPDSKGMDEQAARNYTAMAFAHEMYLMRNPKVREALKQAGKNEERDRGAAALAASVSSGTTTAAGDEKKMTPEQLMKHRMLNARGTGKSFSKAF